MSVQEKLDRLQEIETLCQVLIKRDGTTSQKEYTSGMAQAGKMVLEIINRKGALL